MKQSLTLLLALSLSVVISFGQTDVENSTTQRINNYLNELEKIGFNGAVLIELNGEVNISKGYGFSNKEKQIKSSPKTIYDIGSITKQFTAAAILKLEMQGKLSTGDKISEYFEDIPKDKESITIHDLLRHQSGLISNVGKDYEKISEEAFLDSVFSSKLKFAAGTGFGYSNIGYSLLAMIIENVSVMSYETYLYEYLWHPSQMEMTGYTRPDFDKNIIAVGYDREGNIWGKPTDKEWDINGPFWHLKGNGGILSTTEDLYKWHKILLTDKILSKEALVKLYHPKLRDGESEKAIYAYGWDVSKTKRNTRLVWHNGSNRIFYADFLRYIDEGIAMILFTNQSHPSFNNICFETSRIIFNSDFKPEISAVDNEANRNFTNRIIKIIEESGLDSAKSAFQVRPDSLQLLEFMMRNEGFNHIDNEKPEIAILIFEMNVYAYPNSAKALQGLGEGYMESGKKDLALNYFNQSLAINPDNKFLEDLKKKLEDQ